MLRDELGRFRHSALIAASSGGGTRAGQMCLGAAGPNCSHLSGSPAARSAQPGNAAVTSWSRRVAGSIVAPPRGPARDQSDTLRRETGRCGSGAQTPACACPRVHPEHPAGWAETLLCPRLPRPLGRGLGHPWGQRTALGGGDGGAGADRAPNAPQRKLPSGSLSPAPPHFAPIA